MIILALVLALGVLLFFLVVILSLISMIATDLCLLPLLDLLHEHLVVAHLRHHVLGLLPSIHQDVDSLVELIQINLHILLLGLKVLWLFVRIELVQSRGAIIDNISVLRLAAVRGGLFILLFTLFFKFLGPLVRIGVSLLHESQSSLFGSSLNVLSCLREQVAKLDERDFVDAEEHDAVDLRTWVLLFGVQVLGPQGLEHDVGLQIVQNLVVSEVRERRQVQDRLLLRQLIVLVVEHLYLACLDKVHLLHAGLVGDDRFGGLVDSAVKIDY